MGSESTWAEAARALEQVGFRRDWSISSRATFEGVLDPSDLALPATIELPDLDFLQSPIIRLKDGTPGGTRVAVPHLVRQNGALCYLDARAQVLDRYDPGGTLLTCIATAERVLRDAVKGRSNTDFEDEFAAYWSGQYAYIDLSASAQTGEVTWVAMQQGGERLTPFLTARKGLARAFSERHREMAGKQQPPDVRPCLVIDVDVPLTVGSQKVWPPDTLSELCNWLEALSFGAASTLAKRFHTIEGFERCVALRATNGVFVARIDIPSQFRKPEFLKNRPRRLFDLLRRATPPTRVRRLSTRRIDPDYLFSRNLQVGAGLMGKKVALVGCGSIGGFLAAQLARSGAGAKGGALRLYDPDELQPCNLGRHVLGLGSLGSNKAEELKRFISSEVPHVNVESVSASALHSIKELSKFDLVIDATGEEALSIALNQKIIDLKHRRPALLYIWLLGNALAAESLLYDHGDGACYKCLKPVLSGSPRYRVLRDDVPTELRLNYACGDTLFTPYPVSRAESAASLALDMALDWSKGHPQPRLRVRAFEPASVYKFKDCDPERSRQCPACQKSL